MIFVYNTTKKKTKGLLAAVAQGRALLGKGEAESSNLSGAPVQDGMKSGS